MARRPYFLILTALPFVHLRSFDAVKEQKKRQIQVIYAAQIEFKKPQAPDLNTEKMEAK
ncbi:hypothetical protein [Candidatus Protochlamydia phocaeensis]|uniref:hypothetical protein n=1 Tax=Candidatus Protochlamydia phocaeensis TaxID=1414722 RepID=UPI000AA61C39|nr:hypothetical protein [Candidatus Protochlamydia phocaeensis]